MISSGRAGFKAAARPRTGSATTSAPTRCARSSSPSRLLE